MNYAITLSPTIMDVENDPRWKETNFLKGPIFHFRDYGRKGISYRSSTTVDGRIPAPPNMYEAL